MAERSEIYAEALLGIIASEGDPNEVVDELFHVARAVEAQDELFSTLADPHIPVARRGQIVEDLLSGKASPTTIAAVGMIVGTGRARDLPRIVDLLVDANATAQEKQVAEIRSAIDLTDEQETQLAAALENMAGTEVDLKVIIDPSLLGGVVAQVGDRVIDGTVRTRLDQLKASLGT